ncbi:MAG: pectin esterase [Lachnospiraceae bacterium]|nr:pectin esterase [Lachnospiraceae bacterium]
MDKIYLTPEDNLTISFARLGEGAEVVLGPGIYRAKVLITTPGITVTGAGTDKTKIVWDDYAKKLDGAGREYNTFRTWTAAVCADHVTFRDLTIENDALRADLKGQEVALSVLGDDFLAENCVFRSTQDTLFAGPLPPDLIERYVGFLADILRRDGHFRQIYRNCRIEGSVDFIFGCADALFDCCEIRSVHEERDLGFVAAPAHTLEQTEGFVFRNCCFTREEGVSDGSIFLARPWRDYGLSVFENCTYGPHIQPEGFDKWNDTDRDKTARFYETPPVAGRVPWTRPWNGNL